MEQALIERRCNLARQLGAPETDAFQACLDAQLLSLRSDFGRDLVRLSESERKTIDAACRRIRETRGRDAYMDCLGGQLVAIHDRLNRSTPSSTEVMFQSPLSGAPTDGPAPVALAASWASGTMIGGAVATLFLVGGGALVLMKTRRPRRKCRACAMDIVEAGDLCQKCRHDAADALRQAAAERLDLLRAEEDQERRQHEQQEEQRGAKTRQLQDDGTRLQQGQARREDEARRAEDVRQREEAARQRDASLAAAADEVHDPYTVLGISREASPQEISAAYQQAKLMYDASQVDHLGVDIREHFKAKAEAVELAYRQITG
jgi:hypothetical protein